MNKRLYAGFIFAVLLVGEVAARDLPRASPQELGFSPQRLEYIDEFYAEKVSKGEMAGIVVLVARHGKIAHFSAIGYADVEKKRKLQTDAVFRLYSMTKPVAATALMMLYEEGRFQLRDPLSKYIPEFANLRVLRTPDAALDDTVALERPPTMHDVLRHTAGFGHGFGANAVDAQYVKENVFGVDVSLAQMMSKLAKIPLYCQPGTQAFYSVGPDVQGRLVEILSGMPFDEFLDKRLFKPLRMTDTGFWLPAEKAQRLATVHWVKGGHLTPLDDAHGQPEGGWIAQPWSVNSYTVDHPRKGGSVGLVSTAEDYYRYAQMLLNGGELEGARVLSPHTVRYMVRDHLGSLAGGQPGMAAGFGLVSLRDPAAAGAMGSEGSFSFGGAAGTSFLVDPKEDMVLVAMTQHMGAPQAVEALARFSTLVYSALMQ